MTSSQLPVGYLIWLERCTGIAGQGYSPGKPEVFSGYQSKKKIFLSTCPSDKHYIKFVFQNPRDLVQKVCQVPKPNGACKNN